MLPQKDNSTASYKALLATEYKDPYIQVITPPWPWWVRGLVLVAAVERAYLNEDPVQMDHWLITPRDHVYRSWEFSIAFMELDFAPATAEEAIGAAKTAIFLENFQMNRGVMFSATDVGGNRIPANIIGLLTTPNAIEAHGSYNVTLPAVLTSSPGWGRAGKETFRLVHFRVLVARGTCKILQEKMED